MVRDHMHPWVQEFIRSSPFAVLASANADGNCDASPKGGKPGFGIVVDDRHLILPDVKGNRLFQSHENVDANPHVALLFMIPGLDQTARVNGSAEEVDLSTPRSSVTGPWDLLLRGAPGTPSRCRRSMTRASPTRAIWGERSPSDPKGTDTSRCRSPDSRRSLRCEREDYPTMTSSMHTYRISHPTPPTAASSNTPTI